MEERNQPVGFEELARVFNALEGPPHPVRSARRLSGSGWYPKRKALLIAVLVVVVLAVPALALGTQLVRTISEFITSNEPDQAKTFVRHLVDSQRAPDDPAPTAIQRVLTTRGPEGELRLYSLTFPNGATGAAMIDTAHQSPNVAGADWGPPRPLAANKWIELRGSQVQLPGRTPVYFWGIAAPRVRRASVLYSDGHSERVAVSTGYILGWVRPGKDHRYHASVIVAYDSNGRALDAADLKEITLPQPESAPLPVPTTKKLRLERRWPWTS